MFLLLILLSVKLQSQILSKLEHLEKLQYISLKQFQPPSPEINKTTALGTILGLYIVDQGALVVGIDIQH